MNSDSLRCLSTLVRYALIVFSFFSCNGIFALICFSLPVLGVFSWSSRKRHSLFLGSSVEHVCVILSSVLQWRALEGEGLCVGCSFKIVFM